MNYSGPFDAGLKHVSPVPLGSEHFSFISKPGFVQHLSSDSQVIVPDAHLLFSGEYMRIGSDLIISGNGQKFVVGNYFKGETRPVLSTKDGATLSGHIVDALTGHVYYAQAGAASSGEVIGNVQKLSGSATVIRNGVSVELHIGDAVQKGDVVQTGSDSSIGMTFIDGSAFGMTSNARMVLNEMIYDPNGSSNSSLISLVQGTITFVAGQTAKNGNMRVETPVATMGIRGTAVLVEIGANDGPTKFSVLVEPDGHTGSYNLYDKTSGQLIGTVSQAGQVTYVSASGIGQPPTAIEQLKTLADQEAAKALIQEVFKLYFPNYNPDNSNPKSQKTGFGSPGDNINPFLFANTVPDAPPPKVIVIPGTGVDPHTGQPNPPRIFFNTRAQFSADSIKAEQSFATSVQTFKISDLVHIDDPDVGNEPFYDVAVPFVKDSAVIKSAVSTNPNLDANFLSQFLNINQTTGEISFDRLAFNFLGEGESATFKIQVTAQSGPDTGTVTIEITVTGDNDIPNGAPTIVVGPVTDIAGDVKEDTHVTSGNAIVSDGTITFRDVDLTDTHTSSVAFTSSSSTLPGFAAGQHLGTFTLGPVSEITTDTVNTGTVTWHFTLNNSDSVLQSLAEGQTITQVYTITVKDIHDAFVTQDVTITITGTNDAPVLTADAAPFHQAAEIFNSTDSVVEDIVSGTLTFADLDLTDTHQAVATLGSGPGAVVWSGGTYSGIPAATVAALYNAMSAVVSENNADANNQGSVIWQFKLPDYLFDFLGHSETLTVTYDVKVADYNNGVATGTYSTQQVTVQITANNDKPVVTAITPVGSVQEDTVAPGDLLKATGSVTFADADLTDTHTVQATYVGAVASSGASVSTGLAAALAATALSVPSTALGASTHTFNWDFSLANSLVQYLAAGETVTATYTISVTDNSGVNANNSSAPQTVTVTITGTNDAPVITSASGAASATVAELTATTGSASLNQAGGTVTFGDVDLTDTHQITQSNVTFAWSGGSLTQPKIDDLSNASARTLVPHDSTGTGSGSFDWTYKITDRALDFLALDQTLTVTYDITVADYHNGVATGTSTVQTVTVTYTGTNDAPVVSGAVSDALVIEDGPASVLNVLANASDVDDGAALSVVYAPGTLPAGVTYDPGTRTFTLNPSDAAYQHLADGATTTVTVNYGVSDGIVSTPTSASVSWMITGTNDAPVVDAHGGALAYTENDAPAAIDAAITLIDVDTANLTGAKVSIDDYVLGEDVLGFTAQNGITGVFDAITGVLTLSGAASVADYQSALRSVTYFNSSDDPSGASRTVSYQVDDGQTLNHASNISTATILITPLNDAPVLNGDNVSTQEIGDGSPALPYGTTKVFDITLSDPDETGLLTVSAESGDGIVAGYGTVTTSTGAPLSGPYSIADFNDLFSPTSGVTYTPTSASPDGNDMVTLKVTDSHGLSDTLHFVFQQNGEGGATLTGTTGKDLIFSTGGHDTFVFAPSSNHDIITGGFQSGIDKIDLQALTSFDSAALTALLDTAGHTGGDTLLHINSNTDTLLLKGVAALTASDFILHA